MLVPVLLAATPPAGEQDRVRWEGKMRDIAVFAPSTATDDAPLLLVLGESGRSARYALRSWRAVAEREGFIVASISSQSSHQWRAPQDGPGLLRAVVQRIASRHAVDRRRVYLFGYSNAGGFALLIGMLQPHYFAAVASFESNVVPGILDGSERLERPLPLYLYHSKRMLQFDVEALQQTAAALQEAGGEVVMERLSTGPDFERKGAKAAGTIWAALSTHALSGDPRYDSSHFDR